MTKPEPVSQQVYYQIRGVMAPGELLPGSLLQDGCHVIIVADACATLDPGSAEAVQILFGRVWGYVMQTDDVIAWLTTGEAPKRTRLPA